MFDVIAGIKRVLVGQPIATAHAVRERLNKLTGLAVFASDNLSSVAYATEEILLVLLLAGTAALRYSVPVAVAIALLVAIVVASYRQTIYAYPGGGGAYTVARENLGLVAALVAGGALMSDYVLTVSVSVAASVAAAVSAFPGLADHRVGLGVAGISVLALANLRGLRESGAVFSVLTYFFVIAMGVLLAAGAWRVVVLGEPGRAPSPPELTGPVTMFLMLRAFSSGCSALTGVEAVSNGVPAFKPPEARNAATTLVWMAMILAIFFVGVTVLATHYGIVPREGETVVSQLARTVLGGGPVYLAVQAATVIILLLAANTSFAGFPILASNLAQDGYLARQLATRGDRLVYSNGIFWLGVLAAALLAAFGGRTHGLIPLYAFGVFVSFTLSQSGMVRRHLRLRERGWRVGALMNGLGAAATALVLVVLGLTKFLHGAWIVVAAIPLIVVAFLAISEHYRRFAGQVARDSGPAPWRTRNTVVVPVAGANRSTREALKYALTISDSVRAVYVQFDPESGERVRREWEAWDVGVPLVVLDAPYRSVLRPLLRYLDEVDAEDQSDYLTVVLPEIVSARWWHHFLHNQSAIRIRAALYFRPNTIVTSVPIHLEH